MGNFLTTNLIALRKFKGWNVTKAASELGFKRNTYDNYESGHSEPSIELLNKISSFYGITLDQLVNVDLVSNVHLLQTPNNRENVLANVHPSVHPFPKNEFEDRGSFYVKNPDLMLIKSLPKVVSVDTGGDENTVMVPVRARAGYTTGYGDPHFIEKLPAYKLPGMNNGTFRIFEVEGASMFPTLQDKDLAIARWTPLSEVRDDRVHVIVTRDHGILIKRVLARLESGVLVCKSDHNEKGLYPNIVLNVEEVLECWYVVERMTKHLPSPGEIYKRITDLEADIAIIKQAIGKA